MSSRRRNKNKHLDEEYDLDNPPTGMESEIFDDGEVTVIQGLKNEEPIETCWNAFLRRMRYIWATKQTEDVLNNKKLYINTTIRELLIYAFFVAVLCIITFGMRSTSMYWFTNLLNNILSNQFTDGSGSFSTMTSATDFWKFLTGPLINGLYWNQWYNKQKMDPNEQNFLHYENKLLGVPRLRQVRVRNGTCNIPSEFQKNISDCFAQYSSFTESKDPYGPKNSTAWNYTTDAVLDADNFAGLITTYRGGGFYMDLGIDSITSLRTLMTLFNNKWIDRGTRAVIVDFTIYNANINLFCVIKLVAEFPPIGGIIPNNEFRTVKLIRYVNSFDYFVLSCEILFVIFIIYYSIEEIIEIRKHLFSYFASLWNILDILVIIMSVICICFNVYQMIIVQQTLGKLLTRNDFHPNFDHLSYWQLQFDNLMAFIVFLVTIKIFKYVSFNKMMTQLISTLKYCAKDLLGFSFMFFIIFLAFAQAGYLILGTKLNDYRDFYNCIYTLFRIILNDYTFADIQKANPILGPIFFILYVFFVFFILFNMFLAILDDAYGETKEELENAENEFDITDFLKDKSEKILSKLHLKKEKIVDFENAMSKVDKNNDGKMDFGEWKTELKSRGYEEKEIEALFDRYDTDGDRVLDTNEQLDMLKELNSQKMSLDTELFEQKQIYDNLINPEGKVQAITMERYMALFRRVDALDDIIGNLTMKFDIILDNFQNMNETKSKTKESREKILNTLLSMINHNEEDRKKKLEEIMRKELDNLNESPISTPIFISNNR